MIQIKWFARGGQGGFTASRVLGLAAYYKKGMFIQAFPSFGPERRGAPVFAFTRLSETPVRDHSQVYDCDFAIVVDSTLMDVMDVSKDVVDGGTIFINTSKQAGEFSFREGIRVVTYNADQVAKEILGSVISNTAMMAVCAAHTGLADKESMIHSIQDAMPPRIQKSNIELISRVFDDVNNSVLDTV